MYASKMHTRDPKKYQSRRKAANEAKRSGLEQVAQKYSVTQETVRRWCQEFGVQWATASTPNVAENPNTSAAMLEQFAADNDVDVRRATADNPNTSAAMLEQFVREDPDDWVRENAASNPNIGAALLPRLAEDVNDHVRAGVALNPAAEVRLLDLLADDPHELVRGAVAHNPNTSSATLERLAETDGDTDDDYVISGVAAHQNCPPELRRRLEAS